MDTSLTYVKMCKKAEEIQGYWKHLTGDYCSWSESIYLLHNWGDKGLTIDWDDLSDSNAICVVSPNDEYGEYLKYSNVIWLPRQDQLQEIFGTYDYCCIKLYEMGDGCEPIHLTVDSFEKLWLAFVMKKKFKKIWTEEDWVEEVY